MLEDEFEFAYTTVCPRCGFEIGYDDFPPNECPDCGLSINMSRPTTGAVAGLWFAANLLGAAKRNTFTIQNVPTIRPATNPSPLERKASIMQIEWISVEDKLPELKVSFSHGFTWESDRVLVCGPHYGITIASLYADDGKRRIWWWNKRHGTEQDGITHWMPLPNPPFFLTPRPADLPTCPEGHGTLLVDGDLLFCPVCKYTVSR